VDFEVPSGHGFWGIGVIGVIRAFEKNLVLRKKEWW